MDSCKEAIYVECIYTTWHSCTLPFCGLVGPYSTIWTRQVTKPSAVGVECGEGQDGRRKRERGRGKERIVGRGERAWKGKKGGRSERRGNLLWGGGEKWKSKERGKEVKDDGEMELWVELKRDKSEVKERESKGEGEGNGEGKGKASGIGEGVERKGRQTMGDEWEKGTSESKVEGEGKRERTETEL
jgi:hypothetical protein